jgi:hypothetical protein
MKIIAFIIIYLSLTIGCKSQNTVLNENCIKINYSDYFASPHKIKSYYDYDQGLLCSKFSDKPYLVYFTGHGSVNSRIMEADVWSDSVVLNLLKTKFVIATLFTDDNSVMLANDKIVICQFNGDTLIKYGENQRYLQVLKFKENKTPAFYILNSKEQILAGPYYFNPNISTFINFLNMGIETFSKNMKTNDK